MVSRTQLSEWARKIRGERTMFAMIFGFGEIIATCDYAVQPAIETIIAFVAGGHCLEDCSCLRVLFDDSLRSEDTWLHDVRLKLGFDVLLFAGSGSAGPCVPPAFHSLAAVVGEYRRGWFGVVRVWNDTSLLNWLVDLFRISVHVSRAWNR